MIVGAHTLPSFDWSANPWAFRIIDVICNESSVMFFFIAGFLFHHLSGKFVFADYLRGKFFNVIVPYVLVSIPAIVLFVYFIPKHNAPWGAAPVWEQIVLFYITGRHLAPLWFVPTIALFYLFAPLFLHIDRHARWVYWSLPVLLAISVYIGRDTFWGPLGKAAYLLPAYLGGIFVSRYRNEVESFVAGYVAPLTALTAAIYTLMVFEYLPKPTHIILKLLTALLLLHALRLWQRKIAGRGDYVADVSFGIFFLHAYLIGTFAFALATMSARTYATGVATMLPGSVILYLCFTAVVLGGSVGLIWLTQMILGRRSRLLVGA